MPRIGRIIIEGVTHHVTQRGVRSQNIFFHDEDHLEYLRLLGEMGKRYGLRFEGYCLMDNHIHLLVVPKSKENLAQGIGETHRRYTRMINFREKVRGHLFQERFFSCPLDSIHKISALRYIERNTVRAHMVKQAWDYKWSSASFHIGKNNDDLLLKKTFFRYTPEEWKQMLNVEAEEINYLKKSVRTGKPCGEIKFIKKCENITGKDFTPKKRGPKFKWEK